MKKKLERSKTTKIIGGVSAGIADYFDIDVTLVRVLFLVAFFAPALRKSIGIAARERVEKYYSIKANEPVYLSILNGK